MSRPTNNVKMNLEIDLYEECETTFKFECEGIRGIICQMSSWEVLLDCSRQRARWFGSNQFDSLSEAVLTVAEFADFGEDDGDEDELPGESNADMCPTRTAREGK